MDLFRAANWWWRCAQYCYCLLWLDAYRCVYMAHGFMSVVVTVWGSVGMFLLCVEVCVRVVNLGVACEFWV